MKKARKLRALRPPFEKDLGNWPQISKLFKQVIFRLIDIEERRLWLSLPHLAGFRVFSCGLYGKAYGHAWERRNLGEGVYIYCVEGKGHYRLGDRSWSVTAGDLLYCHPKTHHFYAADEKDPWTIHWMHVSGPLTGVFERLLKLTPAKPVLHIGVHSEIVSQFQTLYTLFRLSNTESRFLAIQACAQQILATIATLPTPSMVPPQRAREIQSIINHMDHSLDKHLRLEDLAARAGISPFHFSRMFKAVTGLPPLEYFNNLKIRRACLLLAASPYKIGEIARQLAFEDSCYFSRWFKKATGIAPEFYRNNLGFEGEVGVRPLPNR